MANTLTDLIPDLYEAVDVVSRELVGFIPSVNMNSSMERAALNESILIPVTRAAGTSQSNTPAVTAPDNGDAVVDNVPITISKSKFQPIRWNGEETKGLKNSGMFSSIFAERAAQAVRSLANEIEADIASEYIRSSRAYGTAGTTPFASGVGMAGASNIKKILDDNGAPASERTLVIDTAAGVNLRNLANLNQQNTAGTDATLRRGVLLPLFGMDIRESAQIANVTKGTGTLYTSDTAGYSVGDTSITLITGSGTILAGDVITFAGDLNKYVVKTGIAAPGTIVLAGPGLREPIAASAVALTVGADFVANMGFVRSAIQLVARMPATPEGGDSGIIIDQVTDPVSGLTFEFVEYKQFLQNVIHVRLAWGFKLIKPEHTAILLG